jgi:hypothetical protein
VILFSVGRPQRALEKGGFAEYGLQRKKLVVVRISCISESCSARLFESVCLRERESVCVCVCVCMFLLGLAPLISVSWYRSLSLSLC